MAATVMLVGRSLALQGILGVVESADAVCQEKFQSSPASCRNNLR